MTERHQCEACDAPVILCQPRKDFEGGLKFYCQYCKQWHYHGRGEGHRVAHCSNPNSPYKKDGYVLKLEPTL